MPYLLLFLILWIYFIITVQNHFTHSHSVPKMQTEATAVIKMVMSPFSRGTLDNCGLRPMSSQGRKDGSAGKGALRASMMTQVQCQTEEKN